jgi:exonuclease III
MSLRIGTWNTCGLKKRLRNSEFRRFAKDFDILILQETFVHQSTRQVSFPGFSLFKKDAVVPVRGRPVGGLGLLVSFTVLNSYRVETEDVDDCPFECLMVKFSRLPSASANLPATFFILNVYVPSFPAPVNYSQF